MPDKRMKTELFDGISTEQLYGPGLVEYEPKDDAMNNNLFNDLLESASDIVAIEREFNAIRQLFADMATVYDMGLISREDYDQLRRNSVDAIVLRSRSKCVDLETHT